MNTTDKYYLVEMRRRLRYPKGRVIVQSTTTERVLAAHSAQAQRKAEVKLPGWSAVSCQAA